MIAFIKQEAQEKADEIKTKADKKFMEDKLSLQTQAGIQIREEFEKKKQQRIVTKKIQRSKKFNGARFQTMKERDNKMNQLKDEVLDQMEALAKNSQYPELLKFLIAQSLMSLMEDRVIIQCRQEDKDLVEKQLKPALELYKSTMKEASGESVECDVVMDKKNFLAAGPVKGQKSAKACRGGIVAIARKGQLICRNTVESRLNQSFMSLKPQLRALLFGIRPKKSQGKPASGHDAHEHKS